MRRGARGEGRRPKPEARRPKEGRNPKPEWPSASGFGLRISELGLLSAFDLRPSAFNRPWAGELVERRQTVEYAF